MNEEDVYYCKKDLQEQIRILEQENVRIKDVLEKTLYVLGCVAAYSDSGCVPKVDELIAYSNDLFK